MRRSIILLLAFTVTLALTAVPVSAGPKVEASGSWWYYPTFVSEPEFRGQNVFLYGSDIGFWEGTFTGSHEEEFDVVCHFGSGISLYKGEMTFTGTVEDETGALRSGTMVIKMNGKVDAVAPDCGPIFDTDWHGHWVIIGGTGELEDVHGHGTFTGPSGLLYYEGQVHFS